ncbi:unnamed protein product [Leptosia nina]|uniref:DNA polymerase V n=1 Tax=Leptosia nina TaxID=320188 RepID=A0AAV1IWE0_9NEOP
MKVETAMEKPRKEVNVSLLEAFDSLKSEKQDVKVNAGAKIILRLQLDKNEKEIQYFLRRVVRSLGANTPNFRTGYFATLVTMLTKFPEITVSQLLKFTKEELHANGSSKSEVGDVSLGQILVCGAIFRSGLILKCSEEEQKQTLQTLQVASTKKSYLGTTASLILLDLIQEIDELQFSSIIWTNIKTMYKKEIKEHTLDSLHFLLVISRKFPGKVKVRKLIGSPEILHEDNMEDLTEKLLEGIDFSLVNHPIYEEFGKQVATSPLLLQVWMKIDGHLTKHNRNREMVAINILSNVFKNINDNVQVISELISKNFFKLFLDWFKGLQTASKVRNRNESEDDQKIMIKKEKELLNYLVKAMKSDAVTNTLRVDVLKKLLFDPGEVNFTEITGTNIIKLICTDLDKDGVKKICALLKMVLLNTSKKMVKEGFERHWFNNERVTAAELISFLVTHDAVKDDTEFKIHHMQLLMCFGFFKISGDNSTSISSELAGSIKSCFYRCFSSRFTNVDDLVTVLSSLCHFISKVLKKENVKEKLEKQFSQDSFFCWNMLMEICESIEQNDSKSKIDKVFLILLYQLGLFLFSEPAYIKMARNSIKELKECYHHYSKGKNSKPMKKPMVTNDEPEWIEVMIEILLSILSIDSSVLRSVVQCVFRLLWENLTPSSIGQIVSVLDPDSAENPLTQGDSENEGSSDSESDDDKDELHTESPKGNGEIEEDSDDGEEDEEEDDDLKNPDQLKIAIQKALGADAADDDTESIDVDDIDEEKGKELDEALAEAFKQYHQDKNKKSKKDRKNKKSLSDFRIRVLDLIDIYLEKGPSMDICLEMIAPLTRALEFCMQDNDFKELENRLRKTVKTLAKVRKFSHVEDITLDVLSDYLKSIIEKGSRSYFMYQALGDVITNIATFIIHCSLKIEQPKAQKYVCPLTNMLKQTLIDFFTNRSCLLPIIFFHNILQLDWSGNYEFIPIIIQNIFDSNIRQFRRNEGLELMMGFYRTLNRNKPDNAKITKRIITLENDFKDKLINAIDDPGYCVKKNFMVLLKKFINVLRSFHENCHIETELDFKELVNKVNKLKKSKTKENDLPKSHLQQNGNKNKKRHSQIIADTPAKKLKKQKT